MSERYDLHCHSTASDGALSPTDVVRRAQQQGVTALALTDHDTTAGLDQAEDAAQRAGIRLIPGIELSTLWQKQCFHVVGIGIDPGYAPLRTATQQLHDTRLQRAEKIADKLAKKQIPGAFEAVVKAAGGGMITRSHFAEFLVAGRYVSTQQEAFDRYLAQGKSAYVATPWADLTLGVNWIVEAGGIAILAHPLRYKLSANAMKRFLAAFKTAGGQGIEVVTGRSNDEEIRQACYYATQFELAGSVGSDFHEPDQWVELGRLASLPKHIKPVWDLLR